MREAVKEIFSLLFLVLFLYTSKTYCKKKDDETHFGVVIVISYHSPHFFPWSLQFASLPTHLLNFRANDLRNLRLGFLLRFNAHYPEVG